MDKNTIIGVIIMAVGFCLILFRQQFVQYVVSFQNKTFGFHFGQRTIDLHVWFAIPFGIFIVIIGILVIAGVWKFK